MPRNVAVIFVHGILNKRLDFAERMRTALSTRLGDQANHVTFRSVIWSTEVRHQQERYMDRAIAAEKIKGGLLRKLLLQGLGDAAAYQMAHRPEDSSYHAIQGCISKVLDELNGEGPADRPLIFIGHSLGCHIISSYAWDLNKEKQRTRKFEYVSAFRRLDTFAGFVTLGSNMPLFTFAFGPKRVYPITAAPYHPDLNLAPAFPGTALEEPLKKKAQWLNFFSRRDVLGFPLKPLYKAEQLNGLLHDIPVVTEAKRWRAVPFMYELSAHKGYWTNETVLDKTTTLLHNMIE